MKKKKMRLLTHNMLSSNIKGVVNDFPLRIEAEKVAEKEMEFNADLLRTMFPKIEWKALSDVARVLGYSDLPEDPPERAALDLELLRKLHHAFLEIDLEEGPWSARNSGVGSWLARVSPICFFMRTRSDLSRILGFTFDCFSFWWL